MASAADAYSERPASRPGRSEHLNILQQFASAYGAKPTTSTLSSSSSSLPVEYAAKTADEEDIQEERYSVYDDDESWPRKLSTEEWGSAGELFEAVEVGDVTKTEDILKSFPSLANVIRLSQGSDFPLYLAAGMGDLAMVQLLVAHCCSVHARTVHGHTALHAAALFGHPNIVQYLLGCGLEVNAVNTEGFPLIEEVLEDIEYDLDESEGGQNMSDPQLLECTAIVLLENGAHLADPEIYADKFCDEYKDVADPRLQKLLLKQLNRFMEEEEALAKLADERVDETAMRPNSDASGADEATDVAEGKTKEPEIAGNKFSTPVKKTSPVRGKTTRLRRRKYSQSAQKNEEGKVSPMASPATTKAIAPTPPARKSTSKKGPSRPTPKGTPGSSRTPVARKITPPSASKSSKKNGSRREEPGDDELEISWGDQLAEHDKGSKSSSKVKLPQI